MINSNVAKGATLCYKILYISTEAIYLYPYLANAIHTASHVYRQKKSSHHTAGRVCDN